MTKDAKYSVWKKAEESQRNETECEVCGLGKRGEIPGPMAKDAAGPVWKKAAE